MAQAHQSVKKLANLKFERAVFGHGEPIDKGPRRRSPNWPAQYESSGKILLLLGRGRRPQKSDNCRGFGLSSKTERPSSEGEIALS
jgi:hypothetical protein